MEKDPFNNNQPFKMPSQEYFDDFSKRLLNKIEQDQNVQKPAIVKLKTKRKYYYMGIAASIMLVLALQIIQLNNSKNAFSNDELQDYIQYDTHLGLSTEFINSFDQEDILELEKNIRINNQELNDYVLTNLDLEYYLID
ncbi:hypothetical protein ACYSNX_01885 [Myroides sp. LJL115]